MELEKKGRAGLSLPSPSVCLQQIGQRMIGPPSWRRGLDANAPGEMDLSVLYVAESPEVWLVDGSSSVDEASHEAEPA